MDEEDLFNPEYVDVERVLDRGESIEPVSTQNTAASATCTCPAGAQSTAAAAAAEGAQSQSQMQMQMQQTPQMQKVVYYLVKWRSLPYEDSTWELPADVDPQRVREWEALLRAPSPDECKMVLPRFYYSQVPL